MSGPSAHLTWAELACHDRMKTPYPLDYRDDGTRLPRLARAFEAIRALWGKRITILSAYRTPAYNKAVGGRPKSQHVEGRALDLQPPDGVTVRQFFDAVVALARTEKLLNIRYVKGYGSRGFVHFDVRPTDRLVSEWED